MFCMRTFPSSHVHVLALDLLDDFGGSEFCKISRCKKIQNLYVLVVNADFGK